MSFRMLSPAGLDHLAKKQQPNDENKLKPNAVHPSLRILGPSNGGVGTCIAGVRGLKIGTFEGSGYLGLEKKQVLPWFYIPVHIHFYR